MDKKQTEEAMFDESICAKCANNGRLGYCLVDNEKVPCGIVKCEHFSPEEDCGYTDAELGIDQDEPN